MSGKIGMAREDQSSKSESPGKESPYILHSYSFRQQGNSKCQFADNRNSKNIFDKAEMSGDQEQRLRHYCHAAEST